MENETFLKGVFVKLIISILTIAAAAFGTVLPFQDNLNSLSPACVSARPDGDQNAKGCGEFKGIGLNRYGYPTVSLVDGQFQCTYGRNEDECRAQIHFAETDSIYTYFELTYAADYDFGAGQKIMRWSSYPSTLISDHIMVSKRGSPVNGLHPMSEIYAERNGGSGSYGSISYSMQRGVKYRVKTFLRMNTGGEYNGVFKLWINDTLKIHSTGLGNYRKLGDVRGFTMVTFMGWLSGSTPASPATYWIDNPRVSLEDDFSNWPVPGSTPPAPPVPPAPPIPPVVIASADTVITVKRDTTRFRVVRTETVRVITVPVPTVISVDSTIRRDTTQVN
jgi:hypothetical protein